MGAISVTMFLGISFLATHIQGITVSEEGSVVGQISHAVFTGGLPFYIVQFFTSAILILAANTAYQDFPRLSSILARDRFMPRQFVNRGDRLVFSNGVIVLGSLASLLIVAFDADLNRLIQLYVVGVFTAFTLSQTGHDPPLAEGEAQGRGGAEGVAPLDRHQQRRGAVDVRRARASSRSRSSSTARGSCSWPSPSSSPRSCRSIGTTPRPWPS